MSEKIVVPNLVEYDGVVGFVHRKKGYASEIDYMFFMNGNGVQQVVVVKEEKEKIKQDKNFLFVLPRFCEKPACKKEGMAVLQGEAALGKDSFKNLGDVNLVVTHKCSLFLHPQTFDSGATVRLVLPKDMGLFCVAPPKGYVFPYLLIAQKSFMKKIGCAKQQTSVPSFGVYRFGVEVDTTRFYDRVARSVETEKILPDAERNLK